MNALLSEFDFDESLDLVITRTLDVPVKFVWRAWTEPEQLKQWFVPKPWRVSQCAIDPRPGGRFYTVMVDPDGNEHPSEGCILDAIPESRIVFTDTLLPGYRPASEPFFTAIILMRELNGGTEYTAIARHGDTATCKKHEEMGFHQGWGTCITQLGELASKLESESK